LTRADAEGKSSCFGGGALGSKGRDDFFEKFVVEIVLGPPGNDLGLKLFPKLKKEWLGGGDEGEERTEKRERTFMVYSKLMVVEAKDGKWVVRTGRAREGQVISEKC
jgi:hypothetical protein